MCLPRPRISSNDGPVALLEERAPWKEILLGSHNYRCKFPDLPLNRVLMLILFQLENDNHNSGFISPEILESSKLWRGIR